jgi:hypothetical protein
MLVKKENNPTFGLIQKDNKQGSHACNLAESLLFTPGQERERT